MKNKAMLMVCIAISFLITCNNSPVMNPKIEPIKEQTKQELVKHKFSKELVQSVEDNNQLLIMYFHNNETCHFCVLMEKTLADQNVIRTINKYFIFSDLNLNDPINDAIYESLASMFQSRGIPNTLIIRPIKDVEIWPTAEVTGYYEPIDYVMALLKANSALRKFDPNNPNVLNPASTSRSPHGIVDENEPPMFLKFNENIDVGGNCIK